MATNVINFSHNWNNKLHCRAFTTIRLYNPNKYKIGYEYLVNLNKKPVKKVVIEDIKNMYLTQINNFTGYLDTGYSAVETKEILKKMYKTVDFTKQRLSFILLKTIE